MEFKKVFKNFYTYIILVIIAYSVYVRAEGIGYSGFQGDEVQTVDYLYQADKGIIQHLLDQKKGPIQYIINILNITIFGYHNEFQIRLPYLVFGILAIYTIYVLAKKLFNKNTGLIAALLISINGLFIAFSRITQYQSLMYFVIPIGIIVFIKAFKEWNHKYFMYAGFIMAFTLLTHYDTLSTVPFFAGVLLSSFIKLSEGNLLYNPAKFLRSNSKLITKYLKAGFVFFASFILPTSIFYIPFLFGKAFEKTTSTYLDNRLFGGGLMPRTEISMKILTMYIPEFHIYFLFVTAVIFLILQTVKLEDINLRLVKLNKSLLSQIYLGLCSLLIFVSLFSLYPIKPRLSTVFILIVCLLICTIVLISKKINTYYAGLICWFLGAYSFYFFIMKDPRTHVYVSFIPLFILSSAAIFRLIELFKLQYLKHMMIFLLIVMSLFISGVNYVIYVDKNPEYPWWDKDFLKWPIYRLKRNRYEKIDGVFGFNNYRGWDKLAEYYKKGCLKGNFKSNEKDSITYFYTRFHQEPQEGYFTITKNIDNIIIVKGPHSWDYVDSKGFDGFKLLKTIKSYDYDVMYIYGRENVYPNGKLLCE